MTPVQPRAALFAAFVVLGLLGIGASMLVASPFALAFGLGCAPLFVVPELVPSWFTASSRLGSALLTVVCWLIAACWMLVMSFGAAYAADAAATPGFHMQWSALVRWHEEVATQPGLVCLALGLMSWPGALETACRLRPGVDRLAAHGIGLLGATMFTLGGLSYVHQHQGGLGWSKASGPFVVFVIPGEHEVWTLAILAVLGVSAAVVQTVRCLTRPVARLLRSEGPDSR